jgi:pyruvate/2-oxoglutarate dehydrogenase complex dihydrolipoamide dehydrogenase (E3) component
VISLKKYEVFIVGGGTAGMAAAEYLVKKGVKVAICESQNLGGT